MSLDLSDIPDDFFCTVVQKSNDETLTFLTEDGETFSSDINEATKLTGNREVMEMKASSLSGQLCELDVFDSVRTVRKIY